MKVQYHALTAVPFLLLGLPMGAIGALFPDLPWVFAELRYRAWRREQRRWRRHESWHLWARRGGIKRLPRWILPAYRLCHSMLACVVCAFVALFLGISDTAGYFFVGWMVHIVLDLFTHDGLMRLQPLFPLSSFTVPHQLIVSSCTVDNDYGRRYVVLLSGGWESAVCLLRAVEKADRTGATVAAVFVAYGQPQQKEEYTAALLLSQHFGLPLLRIDSRSVRVKGKARDGRDIYDDRTNVLCAVAARYGAPNLWDTEFWLGYRAPHKWFDKFGDGNPQYCARMRRLYDYRIVSPVIMRPKWLVKRIVRRAGIPTGFIHSSEVSK